MSTGTKYGGETTGAWLLEKIIREASGNSELLRDFLLFLDAIGTCHGYKLGTRWCHKCLNTARLTT